MRALTASLFLCASAMAAQIESNSVVSQAALGKPIEPFTFENCAAFVGDSTIAEISWKGAENIGSLAGKPLRARFSLGKNAKLYSFWASRDKSGRSDGYVAGGGRGFTSDVDTVGVGSYK